MMIMNSVEYSGIRAAMPPIALISGDVQAVVDHAHAEEQPAGQETVAQHDDDRPVYALHRACRVAAVIANSELNRPSVTKPMWLTRRIGDQLFQVGLHERDQRAVNDADHREQRSSRGQRVRACGQSAGRSG